LSDRPSDGAARYGDFPFALTDGPHESRFLTWLRNHSNYMAVGGLLDYLRMAAVLLRGVFINALILLPPLLVAGLVLSLAYEWMDLPSAADLAAGKGVCAVQKAYLLPIVFALAIGWMLLFPVLTMLTKIAGYQKSLASGSDSSVQSRDRYERSFAIALLVVLGAAAVELLPHVVCYYHQFRPTSLPWREYIAAATVAVGSLSAAPKLLKMLGGAWHKLAVAAIGLGGLLAPLIVVVAVCDYIISQNQAGILEALFASLAYVQYLVLLLLATPAIFVAGILIAMATGFYSGTFSRREYGRLFLVLLAIVALHVLMFAGIYAIFEAVVALKWDTGNLPVKLLVLAVAAELWLFGWLTVDINQTSVHALYRDRLASAFLLGVNARGEADIEEDVPLSELCYHETGSTAPYHLINTALNLQGSADIGLRDRHSDFFIFSKKFIGGERTGYCRSASMEQVFPQVNLASAMAISAAAASPNMGRSTSPALVAFMTLINVRLGVWVPNPGRLEEDLARHGALKANGGGDRGQAAGFDFAEVFAAELESVVNRWRQLDDGGAGRSLAGSAAPTTDHGLAGIAFSGGGIRSATINLGIVQALHRAGLFRHFDYMSTVSGGGYLGSSISTAMRFRTLPVSEIEGTATVATAADNSRIVTITSADGRATRLYRYSRDAELLVGDGEPVKPGTRLIRRPGPRVRSEIAGTVAVRRLEDDRQVVTVSGQAGETRQYDYTRYDDLAVEDGQSIAAGQLLVKPKNTFFDRLRWRVRPQALLLETTMRLDEKHRWVNLSDGGHIENLAAIELLRRRCKFVVIGDGECDPNMYFAGLATLIRTARIDLGVHIDINLDELRLDGDRHSGGHLAIGQILYPGEKERGYLLYLKSSCTGDEDEVIGAYRHQSSTFPHETTADQFFNEGQFEAYRALGEHIGDWAVRALAPSPALSRNISFGEFSSGFQSLWQGKRGAEMKPPESIAGDAVDTARP
jgi:hypothetical protein